MHKLKLYPEPSRYPFSSYPRSWYQVARSKEIARGRTTTLRYFGRDLVGYRGTDNRVRIYDAHCPHLGAHLGVGGIIDGNSIVCPFHAWKFDGDGVCQQIPYCDRIPQRARLRAYPVREQHGLVFIYYSDDRRAPEFALPTFPEFGDAAWSRPADLQYEIRSHVQEMAENALDTGHFPGVHDLSSVPNVESLDVEESQLTVRMKGERRVFGLRSPMDFTLRAVGLGFVLGATETRPVSIRAIHAVTPIDSERLRVTVTYVFKKDFNPLRTLVLHAALGREVRNFTSGDRRILENKRYVERPTLCATDGPIGALRKWARRFYDEAAVAQPGVAHE
jgi:3-ketosteroid 9alpha-monooxygenase subunit A